MLNITPDVASVGRMPQQEGGVACTALVGYTGQGKVSACEGKEFVSSCLANGQYLCESYRATSTELLFHV